MAFNIPTYDIHVRPKYYSANDGASSGFRAVWLPHTSTNATTSLNGGRNLMTPDATRTGIKSWEWWLAFEIYIETTWDPSLQGAWGTTWDWHTSSYDNSTPCGPIGWTWGVGTGSVFIEYRSGHLYQHIEHGSFVDAKNLIVSNLAKGQWHSVLNQVILGRTDGSITASGHPNGGKGRFRTWLNGSNTPIDSGDTNTLQRGQCSADGQYYTQTQQAFWDVGFYTKNCTQDCNLRMTASRVGRTLAECLAESNITLATPVVSNILDPNGVGPDLGPSSYSVLTSRTDTDFLVPSSLGGNPAPSGLPHDGPWTSAVQWNATSADPTDPPPTVTEQHVGPWSTAVEWNAGNFSAPQSGIPSLTLTAKTTNNLTLTPT